MDRRIVRIGLLSLFAALVVVAGRTSGQNESVEQGQANTLMSRLGEPIETKDFQVPGGMSLKDALGLFVEKLAAKGMELPILVDSAAFREESIEVYETPIRFPPFPRRLALATALRLALDQVPEKNATYLVRPTHILITTLQRATPEKQTIRGLFVKRPLEAVLEELSAQTGISVLLDPKVGDKAKTPVTAKFRNETSLPTAVRVLADMADLRVVVVENVLYVTSKSNPVEFGPAAAQ
jgi:hypothetical protein